MKSYNTVAIHWIMPSQNVYVEALTSNEIIFGNRAYSK